MATASALPEIIYLANYIEWFGKHTGYERLPDRLPAGVRRRVILPRPGLLPRLIGKAASFLRDQGPMPQGEGFARLQAEILMRRDRSRICHMLYAEGQSDYWQDVPHSVRRRTVLSFHQPLGHWEANPWLHSTLKRFQHGIVLWKKDLDWFQSRLTLGNVTFIPHGADVEFFCPSPAPVPSPKIRLLYAGLHLRNTEMMTRVVRVLAKRNKDLQFDLLVPVSRRLPELAGLIDHPQVVWHAGLSDEQLRELYRSAFLLLLPMMDSGANTAVVDGMACGLPVVTTDVGGIRDYGGGSVYPLVANDDDDAMIDLVESYVAKPSLRDETARRCRAFAESTLAWPLIIEKHLEVYRSMP